MRSVRAVRRGVFLAGALFPLAMAHAADAAVEPLSPVRVLDTRAGVGAPGARLEPGQVLQLSIPGTAGASAVALNLTADGALGAGYVSAWPCGEPAPATSILNVVPGRAAANLAVLRLAGGQVCFASSTATHLIADLGGTFTGTADVTGIAPSRVLDTRTSGERLRAGEDRRLRIAGTPGVPDSAVGAALNITVTGPVADGYVLAYPCGQQVPVASTVNFRVGEDIPNFTIADLDGDDICLRSSVDTHVIVDAFGYVPNGGELRALPPDRLLDTRQAATWPHGVALQSGQTFPLRVAGKSGVANDAAAALITVTVDNASADGFVTAWPCDEPRPNASVLNLFRGALRSNLSMLKLAADGTVCFAAVTYDGSPVHLVVDAVGSIAGGPARSEPPSDPTPPPSGPPPTGGRFVTLPPGTPLPTNAQCAAAVRDAAEIRPQNAGFNTHPGPAGNGARATGGFTGTTDEILQWVACKWGIDEDVVRAQVAKESWWKQTALGDWTSDATTCAPGHQIGADGRSGQCPQSVGLLQVRTPYFRDTIQGSVVSSSYNVDVAYADWRACFEGEMTWLNTVERGRDYAAGDMWGCLGRWFSGRWYTAPALDYMNSVSGYLGERVWETPNFIGDHTP